MPGLDRVYYCNSGSEANEKAFKMVRQIAHKRYGGKKHKILYRDRDYQAPTIRCLASAGQEPPHPPNGPHPPSPPHSAPGPRPKTPAPRRKARQARRTLLVVRPI